jgi:DNA topoisomerase-6 subunit B
VPFTSESKEAIADYDEIRKEIKLALQECGRRLGVFLRRRERAQTEFRRRNIFELYIEEVAEACARLKAGKLAKEKLKSQLQKIALKRTGGVRTDEILGLDNGRDGLPHSIVVTPDGTEGEAPGPSGAARSGGAPPNGAAPPEEPRAETGRRTAGRRPGPPAPRNGGAEPARSTGTAARPATAVERDTERRPGAVKRKTR